MEEMPHKVVKYVDSVVARDRLGTATAQELSCVTPHSSH